MDRIDNNLCPSDDDFRCHFESVLNREDVNNGNVDDVTTYVTIPILDEPHLACTGLSTSKENKTWTIRCCSQQTGIV